jgi:hypothetical protein
MLCVIKFCKIVKHMVVKKMTIGNFDNQAAVSEVNISGGMSKE